MKTNAIHHLTLFTGMTIHNVGSPWIALHCKVLFRTSNGCRVEFSNSMVLAHLYWIRRDRNPTFQGKTSDGRKQTSVMRRFVWTKLYICRYKRLPLTVSEDALALADLGLEGSEELLVGSFTEFLPKNYKEKNHVKRNILMQLNGNTCLPSKNHKPTVKLIRVTSMNRNEFLICAEPVFFFFFFFFCCIHRVSNSLDKWSQWTSHHIIPSLTCSS